MASGVPNLHRKAEIEEGLLRLMETLPYGQITVKDLTDSLCIARKTFYHYFPNKDACLESLTDRLIYECNLCLLQQLPWDATSAQRYAMRLKYWMEHRGFLEAVIRNKLESFLLDRFLQYMRREHSAFGGSDEESGTMDEDTLFFFMSGQIFLLLKWCHEGFTLPLEEMVQKYLRLIHEPLVPFGKTEP